MALRLSWTSTASWKWFLFWWAETGQLGKEVEVLFEASPGQAVGTVTLNSEGCGCAAWHHSNIYVLEFIRKRSCVMLETCGEPAAEQNTVSPGIEQGLCKTIKNTKSHQNNK